MQISQFFLNGDIKGAIAYMRDHEEFKDTLPAYAAIFEDCKYRSFEIPDMLNEILRLYQIYFRDTYYCGLSEADAAGKLIKQLRTLLNMPNADEESLTEQLKSVFEANGYHALFGKTQGYYGPYIWRDTIPTVYRVELPDGTAEYTVNILKGFVFRSWMDYLTFGRYGTGGWASPDGTINCIEQAYDLESERFRVSLLKHEAQHTVDRKRFPQITPAELEYRAKLVELKQQQHAEKISDIKGVQMKIEWGSQIRSYVFMPYQLVKDTRTGYETSQLDNVNTDRRGSVEERQHVWMNTADAQVRGLKNGDVVLVKCRRGACLCGLQVSDRIKPGVASIQHGAWFEPENTPAGRIDVHGNANTIAIDVITSKIARGNVSSTGNVEVSLWKDEEPPVRIFNQPRRVNAVK